MPTSLYVEKTRNPNSNLKSNNNKILSNQIDAKPN